MTRLYQSLSKEERVELFVKCQEFLIKNHPKSEFILRRNFLKKLNSPSLQTLMKLYKEFNGSVYAEENCIIFFKIFSIKDGLTEIYKKYDKMSDDQGNTIFIVFAAFDEKKINIYELIRRELMGEISQISFSREGKFKIYPLDKLAKKFKTFSTTS
jgi:hypothetical protein